MVFHAEEMQKHQYNLCNFTDSIWWMNGWENVFTGHPQRRKVSNTLAVNALSLMSSHGEDTNRTQNISQKLCQICAACQNPHRSIHSYMSARWQACWFWFSTQSKGLYVTQFKVLFLKRLFLIFCKDYQSFDLTVNYQFIYHYKLQQTCFRMLHIL